MQNEDGLLRIEKKMNMRDAMQGLQIKNPTSKGSVERNLENLQQNVHLLDQLISELQDRIAPILGPDYGEPECDSRAEHGNSTIGNSIGGINYHLEDLSTRLRILTDRVDL